MAALTSSARRQQLRRRAALVRWLARARAGKISRRLLGARVTERVRDRLLWGRVTAPPEPQGEISSQPVTEEVLRRWGETAHQRAAIKPGDIATSWLDSRVVKEAIVWPRFGGSDWWSFLKRRHLPQPAERAISICCGDGHLERDLQRLDLCRQVDAFDVSPEAVRVAQDEAARRGCTGLHYFVADANTVRLQADYYDAAFAAMALHHVADIEHLLEQLRRALKPGAVVVVNEYIGPSRFQWTDEQIRIINDLLIMLPPRLRTQISEGALKPPIPGRPSIADMIRTDPSEAVRSAEIPGLLSRYFELDTRIDYGGTILYRLLEDIVGNFDPQREEDMALLRLLAYLEQELIHAGALQSDFAFFVLRRPR